MFQSPRAASLLPIASNGLLVALKLSVGIAIGSISVVSDALDTGIDILSAFVAFAAIRIAVRPPDAGHPFGHGKAENLGGVVESFFIIAGGVFITYEAVRRIIVGAELRAVEAGIAVMGLSVLMNVLISQHLIRVARKTGSPALAAAGKHRATDVLTSLAVLLGLIVVRISGVTVLDPILALVVAVVVFWAAGDILRGCFNALMDVSLPEAEEQHVRRAIDRYAGQTRLEHLHTRKGGQQRYFDITLTTCQHMSVGEAHHLCDHIEDDIRRAYPKSQVSTHVEPCTLQEGAPCPASCPVNGAGA